MRPSTGSPVSGPTGLTVGRLTLYLVLASAAVAIPLWLNLADAAFLEDGFGRGYAIFGLFALSTAMAIGAIGGLVLYRRRGRGWEAALPLVLTMLLGFHFLVPLSENRAPTSDYRRYERMPWCMTQPPPPCPLLARCFRQVP